MNCMKCGREIKHNQVFCQECLSEMEKYPVRPETVIQLPHRQAVHAEKKTHKKKRQNMSSEEQVAWLKKRYRRLAVAFLAMVVLAVMLGVLSGVTINELDMQKWLGQNYSTVVTPTETTPGTGISN